MDILLLLAATTAPPGDDEYARRGIPTPSPRGQSHDVVTESPAPDPAPSLPECYGYALPSWQAALRDFASDLSGDLETTGLHFLLRYRVKSLRSLIEGLRAKSRINDLLGARVVVPFKEDVELVVERLRNVWGVLEEERKADGLSFREFGYDSIHLLLPLADRLDDPLPPGCHDVIEVQVRTTLQDAWAEVEHELLYKSPVRFPDETVRQKMAALNAMLTLADITFQEIRDQQSKLALWGQERFHELKRRAEFPPLEDPTATSATPGGAPPLLASGERDHGELEAVLVGAFVAHKDGKHEQAVEAYTRALRLGPTPPIRSIVLNHRGMARIALADEAGAFRDFDQAVSWNPRNPQALINRALAWRRFGRVEEAQLDLNAAGEAGADRAEVDYLRAQTFAETEMTEEALAILEPLLRVEPGHEAARALCERLRSPADLPAASVPPSKGP